MKREERERSEKIDAMEELEINIIYDQYLSN